MEKADENLKLSCRTARNLQKNCKIDTRPNVGTTKSSRHSLLGFRMFGKDLLRVEAENNKISTKFLVSVEYDSNVGFGYRIDQFGSITPTLWEGHYVNDFYTYYDGSGSVFWVAGNTTGIAKSLSITRLDTNKTLSCTGSYFPFAGKTCYHSNDILFTSNDVNKRIEIEVWYEI